MAKQYAPQAPFNVPFKILSAQKIKINGVEKLEYIELDTVYYCSAKAYGGSEKVINGLLIIEDTLTIDTYYTPDLKSKDRIRLLDDDSIYEVMNTPERINRTSQYMRFKVVRIHG